MLLPHTTVRRLNLLLAIASNRTLVGVFRSRRGNLHASKKLHTVLLSTIAGTLLSAPAFCQSEAFNTLPSLPSPREDISAIAAARFDVSSFPVGTFSEDAGDSGSVPG